MTFPTIIGMTAFGLAFLAFAAVYWRIRQASFKAPQVPANDLLNNRRCVYVEETHVHGDTSSWRGE